VTRALLTNDDGIDADGLHRLAAAARDAGLDVVVAAPAVEASGSSASLIVVERDGRVAVAERDLPGLPGIPAYAVAAPPAFIALTATRGAFGPPPDIVLSGINRGANTGRAVLHSGTVGAALTAAANGCPAMAVSLDIGHPLNGRPHWDTAARLATELLYLLDPGGPPIVVNLNVPDLPPDQVRGLRRGTLATFGAVQTNVEIGDGYVRMALEDTNARLEPGTDAALLTAGYASVTPLNLICESTVELDIRAPAR
jgi:5'-nucleotidase